MLDVSDSWDDSWPIPTGTNSVTIDLNDHKLDCRGAATQLGPTSICRSLIREGVSPLTAIEFYRGSTLCFTKPNTVGEWAGIRVQESQDGKFPRFVSFPAQEN